MCVVAFNFDKLKANYGKIAKTIEKTVPAEYPLPVKTRKTLYFSATVLFLDGLD